MRTKKFILEPNKIINQSCVKGAIWEIFYDQPQWEDQFLLLDTLSK